jgi:predicted  nucleic acid-binding Zn-ribbon protein
MKITTNDKDGLLNKQNILSEIEHLKSEIANIPEQIEINKLEEIDSDDKKIILQSDIHDLNIEIQRNKTDLDKVDTDKQNNNEKLAGGILSKSEMNFINSDIERQSKRQQELRRKILEIEENVAAKKKQVEELDNEIVENDKKISTLKIVVKEKSEKNLERIAKLENEYKEIKMSNEVEEIFQNHLSNNISVAKLTENNMCSACKLVQPPSSVQTLKNVSSDELIFCEECDRILLKQL